MLSYHHPCLTFHLPLCLLFVKSLHLKFNIIVIELQTFIFIMCSINTLIIDNKHEKKHEATNNAKNCYCQWINLEHFVLFKDNGHCNNNPLSLKACVKHTTYECKVVCERCDSYKIIEWNYYNYMKTTILQVVTIRKKKFLKMKLCDVFKFACLKHSVNPKKWQN
jgi:hypothetical protein